MLDALKVDLYGERLALKAVGSVSVRDAQMLSVSPFDPQVCTRYTFTMQDAFALVTGSCNWMLREPLHYQVGPHVDQSHTELP